MFTTDSMWFSMLRLFLRSLLLTSLALTQYLYANAQSLDTDVQKHMEDFNLDAPSIDDYKEAVIGFFQQMAAVGYGNESVVVFGGMSLWNYFRHFRYTPVG
jgi:hypothetical protein